MQRINRYGKSGSPCLIPLVGIKNGVGDPLIRIEVVGVDTHHIMRVIKCDRKLKYVNVWRIKIYFSLSKAFSKSILGSMLEHLDLNVLN